jgi:hypothetical protein
LACATRGGSGRFGFIIGVAGSFLIVGLVARRVPGLRTII